MSTWGIKASMPRGQNAQGQVCPIRRFYYAHTLLRCFLVIGTFSASSLWHCHSTNIDYPFAYMSTLRHSYGVSVILAWLKTSVPETKISVI